MFQEADLAITDLTITSEREGAVDFTNPFMTLGECPTLCSGVHVSMYVQHTDMLLTIAGIAILYKSPQKESPSLFSFMAPFTTGVWLCMFSVYMGVSVLLWIMGRCVSCCMLSM